MNSVRNIELLTRDNFDTWRIQVQALLIKNDAWKYVNGTSLMPKHGSTVEQLQSWESADEKARADLILAMSPSELKHIRGCTTAREVWVKLESIYASKGPAKKATLLKRLTLHKMCEGDDVYEHISKFFEAVDKLSDMDVKIHEDLLSIMLLYSLPPSYENFRCAMETRDELPRAEVLKIKIIEEDSSRKQSSTGNIQGAMHTKRQEQSRKETFSEVHPNKNMFRYKCYKCHKYGHKASQCTRKNKIPDSRCATTAENREECTADSFGVLNYKNSRDSLNNKYNWILDSGCTSHLCKDKSKFTDTYVPTYGNLNLASKMSTKIRGKGNIRLSASNDNSTGAILFRNTLHVPDLRTNLVSIAKITDNGYEVTFKKNVAYVTNSDGVIKLTADRKGDLYYVRESNVQASAAISKNVDVWSWHERLGHLNAKDLIKTLKKSGIEVSVTDVNELYKCDICARAKMSALPFSRSEGPCTEMLKIVHSDVVGPMRNISLGGAKYFVTFIDDSTRLCEVYLLSTKSKVFEAFKQFKNYAEKLSGKKIKYLQSDNGGEYCNREFDDFLKKHGIQRRLTVAHTPQQNGVAERMNRTLVEMARCMLLSSGLPMGFWGEAVVTACHVRNICPTSSLEGNIPYEKWHGAPIKLKYLRTFGAKAYVLDKTPSKNKFAARSKQGIFVGYAKEAKGYRVWLPDERKVVISRDVKFLEEHRKTCKVDPFIEGWSDGQNFDKKEERNVAVIDLIPVSKTNECEKRHSERTEYERDHLGLNECEAEHSESKESDVEYSKNHECVDGHSEQNECGEGHSEMSSGNKILKKAPGRPKLERTGKPGRPKRVHKLIEVEVEPETDFDTADEADDTNEIAGMAEISLKQALSSKDRVDWEKAILSEITSLVKNDTWDIVKKPKDRKVVGCRYVLTVKLNVDKSEKKKARLVAKGFSQRYGVDYYETFAPVARIQTVRLLVALAAELNMDIHQLDINTAYLNGLLDEEVYMKIPELLKESLHKLLFQEGRETDVKKRAKVMLDNLKAGGDACRLKKSLYGLKQAGRQWYLRLDEKLKRMQLKSTLNEPCMYHARREDGKLLIVVIYVDDILVASQDTKWIQSFKRDLAEEFELKDFEFAKYCLGIEIERKENSYILSQRKYVDNLLRKFNMDQCNPVSTPMEVGLQLQSKVECNEEQWPYRELIGALMYLSTGTRPDIAHTVSKLAQFTSCPTKIHWGCAKRLLRYLKKTIDFSLVYNKTGESIKGFSDADWGNCLMDRCSYSGYSFILGGAAISWKSQKQRTVAMSSTEAEYVSMAEGMKEAVYLKSLLSEIGLNDMSKVTLYVDNRGALCLANDPVGHSRSKHIDIKYHFLRTIVKEKRVTLEHISTDMMVADVLTKALPSVKHYFCVKGLGLVCLTTMS